MKFKFLVLLIVASSFMAITGCSTSRGGCKATQGYVGYGH